MSVWYISVDRVLACLCGTPMVEEFWCVCMVHQMGDGFWCVCMVHQWWKSSGVSVWYTNGGGVLVCLCGTPMGNRFRCVYVVHQWRRGFIPGMIVWYTSGGGSLLGMSMWYIHGRGDLYWACPCGRPAEEGIYTRHVCVIHHWRRESMLGISIWYTSGEGFIPCMSVWYTSVVHQLYTRNA